MLRPLPTTSGDLRKHAKGVPYIEVKPVKDPIDASLQIMRANRDGDGSPTENFHVLS